MQVRRSLWCACSAGGRERVGRGRKREKEREKERERKRERERERGWVLVLGPVVAARTQLPVGGETIRNIHSSLHTKTGS